MIRYERRDNFGGTGHEIYDYMGESSETKPTEMVADYSLFMELDTGKVYYFKDNQWKEKA